jgi:putative serine protease PepD
MLGQVIGVNAQIESDSGGNDGVGFAIPSDTVKSVVSQLISGGKVAHAYLGVQIQDASNGAEITSVKSGAPAADAGLRKGDVVRSLDGDSISSADELRQAVDSRKAGEQVTLNVLRDGKSQRVTVTLGTRPS